jgi:hypothetical protein
MNNFKQFQLGDYILCQIHYKTDTLDLKEKEILIY